MAVYWPENTTLEHRKWPSTGYGFLQGRNDLVKTRLIPVTLWYLYVPLRGVPPESVEMRSFDDNDRAGRRRLQQNNGATWQHLMTWDMSFEVHFAFHIRALS